MNWRAELRAAGVERRPSNTNEADRGFIEQPGEGTPDKPPSSVPRTPPHSRRLDESAPVVLRRPVTSLTPPPPPPDRETRIFPPPSDRDIFPPPSQASLPLPSAEPTKQPEQQTLVRLVRPAEKPPEPEPSSEQRTYRKWTPEIKAAIVARVDAGESQRDVAKAYDTHQATVSRFVLEAKAERGAEMASKAARNSPSGFSQAEKDRFVQRALKIGKGGQTQMAEEAGVSSPTMSHWTADYLRRNPDGAAPASQKQTTMVSSRVASKSNGAALPELPPFLKGLDEYINQIVDARVEETVKRILRTTSLMELMKQ